MKRPGTKLQGELQRLEQGDILGDIIVLMPDGFFDFDSSVGRAVDHYSNTRRAGIPEGAAIDVGNQIRHVF